MQEEEPAFLGQKEKNQRRFDFQNTGDGIICEDRFDYSGIVGVKPVSESALPVRKKVGVTVRTIRRQEQIILLKIMGIVFQCGIINPTSIVYKTLQDVGEARMGKHFGRRKRLPRDTHRFEQILVLRARFSIVKVNGMTRLKMPVKRMDVISTSAACGDTL